MTGLRRLDFTAFQETAGKCAVRTQEADDAGRLRPSFRRRSRAGVPPATRPPHYRHDGELSEIIGEQLQALGAEKRGPT